MLEVVKPPSFYTFRFHKNHEIIISLFYVNFKYFINNYILLLMKYYFLKLVLLHFHIQDKCMFLRCFLPFFSIWLPSAILLFPFIKINLQPNYAFAFSSTFRKFITKSIITSFSLGFDSAINNVSAARVLLSIVCFPFLYNIP